VNFTYNVRVLCTSFMLTERPYFPRTLVALPETTERISTKFRVFGPHCRLLARCYSIWHRCHPLNLQSDLNGVHKFTSYVVRTHCIYITKANLLILCRKPMLVIVMRMVPIVTAIILMVSNHKTVLFIDGFQTDVNYVGNKKGSSRSLERLK
jgi:hypothetical protein